MPDIEDKILEQMLDKLKLPGDDQVVRKAKEIQNLIRVSNMGAVNGLNDNAKTIISLDLAYQVLRLPFDVSHNFQYLFSGLKKPNYLNTKRTLEKILNLSKTVSISDLCFKHRIVESSGIIEKAEKMFKAFKETYKKNVDFNHPQYPAIVVYTTCKLEKIKVAKKDFQASSNLKPNQWILLEKEFDNWLVQSNFGKTNSGNKGKGGSGLEKIEDEAEKDAQKRPLSDNSNSKEPEDYKTWKKRILEEAYRELKAAKSS